MSDPVRAAFAHQARACAGLGSPFMGRLMALCGERLSPGGAVADRVLAWAGDPAGVADSLPLRLAGALHGLKRAGHAGLAAVYPPGATGDDALWAAVEAALAEEAATVLAWLDSPPQTNEVRRAAALIPAMHLLAARFGLPLRLSELGAAAGLNLFADRFRLEAGPGYGDPDASVRLSPDWQGLAPPPADLRVTERAGVDLNPLDPDRDAPRLLAYLWPDQPERLALTEAAIAIARAEPAALTRGDAADWLAARLAAPAPGTLHLVYHTIAWQYFPAATRAKAEAALAAAGARATPDAPLARFAMEADGASAALSLQVWPEGGSIGLGRADYHGRGVRWAGTPRGEERDR